MKDLVLCIAVIYFWLAVLIAIGWIIYRLIDGKELLDEIVQDIERAHKRCSAHELKENRY